MLHLCPERPTPQKPLHHFGMSFCKRFVVIVNEDAISCLDVLQETLESRHDLLKGLFVNRIVASLRIEMHLVYALREEASNTPS